MKTIIPHNWPTMLALAAVVAIPAHVFGWGGVTTRGASLSASNASGHGKITIDAYNASGTFKTWLTGGNGSGTDLTKTLLTYVAEADVEAEKTYVAQLDDNYSGYDIIENATNDSVQHCAAAIRFNLADDPRLWNARECIRLAIQLKTSSPATSVRIFANGIHLLQDYFAHGNASCTPPDPHGIPATVKVDTNGDLVTDTLAGNLCDDLLWDNHSNPADSTDLSYQTFNPYISSWWHKHTSFGLSWRYQASWDLTIEAMQCLAVYNSIASFDTALASGYVVNGPRTTRIDLLLRNAQFGNLFYGPTAFKCDFDGDGKADFAVWRPSNNTWYVKQSSNGTSVTTVLGAAGDVPVPGDYDGDGKTDRAVWSPATATWSVLKSSTSTVITVVWGAQGDVPVVGDFDGDGKSDYGIWRPTSANWYVKKASDLTNLTTTQYGQPGDIPTPGDYDHDGKTDFSIWRQGEGKWYILKSSTVVSSATTLGWPGDVPIAGDYDGDGKTDMSVWRNSTGRWYVIPSTTGTLVSSVWGVTGDFPVAGDFDGDGKTDKTVWRPSNASWYLLKSSNGTSTTTAYGAVGDIVP
jgi:FG-GAP-like repeat